MNAEQQNAILAIALFAAFADGTTDERERERIRQLTESLGDGAGEANFPKLYQDVLLRRVSLESVVEALWDANHRQLAYEIAVCVCDADGSQSDGERRFLDKLKALLGLDGQQARQLSSKPDEIVELAAAVVPATAAAADALPRPAQAPDASLDRSILNYAILTGALEILPQSWASLAIIPLQVKMIYKIGKHYGYVLDQGHIKEFLATAGVGLTSQYVEQVGRKLLGGLLGKVAGGMAGKLGQVGTGAAFSFATTYALGHVANRYYAGGRQMSASVLQDAFQRLVGPAKEMQVRFAPEIEQTAQGLDAAKVMDLVRAA